MNLLQVAHPDVAIVQFSMKHAHITLEEPGRQMEIDHHVSARGVYSDAHLSRSSDEYL